MTFLSRIFIAYLLFSPAVAVAGELVANLIQRDPYGMIHAQGDILYTSNGLEIRAQNLVFDTDSQVAELDDAKVRMKGGHKLNGKHLQRIDLETFQGEDVVYTLCPDDDLAWKIVADSATLDKNEGLFTAKHARFEWGGIPVLYTPYWSHALNRRSGLLMPKFANSTRRGFQTDVTLYWAGSPNWDMTLMPRLMSVRGTMADVEWRHKSHIGEETLQVQSLADSETGTQRGRLRTNMNWKFAPTIDAALNIDAVNDGLYIADFPFYDGDIESAAYLTSNATLTWREGSDSAILSSRYQQILGGSSNASTLQVLPRLQTRNYFDVGHRQVIQLDQQSTVFQRDNGSSGTRIGLRPSWSLPWQMEGGAVSANWTVLGQATGYNSQNFTSSSSSYTALASSLQVESIFERVFDDQQWRHEIKPILRFDVSSTKDQSFQPRYDSSLLPLNISNLMQGNRYSGWDRFERMRKVSFLLNSTFQSKTSGQARNIFETQLGIAYDGLKETVDVVTASAPSKSVSNLLAELAWMPFVNWKMSAGGQHDSSQNSWVEAHGGLSWAGEGQYFNVAWRKTDASYSQEAEALTVAGKVKFNQRWSSNTVNQYDLLRKHVIQTRVGVAYSHACWDMSLEGFKTYQVGSNSLTDIGWRFLIAFEGLGSFGDK
ncbi:MAG: LPS assembly protein LptD [Ghiorsea sp.]